MYKGLILKRVEVIAVSVAFIVMVSPAQIQADTLSELQAQIQALTAQIAALQGTQTITPSSSSLSGQPDDYGTGTTPGSSCPKLTLTMQRGSRDASTGGQVSELQIFLANYFDLNEEDIVTGYFGKLTQANVAKFQKEYGLPSFGIAGSMTRAKIAEFCGGGSTTSNSQVSAALVALPSTGLADGRLLAFSLTATPAGEAMVKDFTLGVITTGITPNTPVNLYAYTDASFSSPIPGYPEGFLGSGSVEGTAVNFKIVPPGSGLRMPGGGTYYFLLRDSEKGDDFSGAEKVETILYIVSGSDAGGISQTRTGSGVASNKPSCTMSATPSTVKAGEKSRVTFTTANASSATLSYTLLGEQGSPPRDRQLWENSFDSISLTTGIQVYYLTVTGIGGTSACSTTITITPATATYRAYLDGSATANVTTEDATEAYALENCKQNAASNPTKSIRCTWGEKEIYAAAGTPVTTNSSKVVIGTGIPSGEPSNPDVTVMDRALPLANGSSVQALEVYSATAQPGSVKIFEQINASQLRIVFSQDFNHPGGGFAGPSMTAFKIPATGNYYAGSWLAGSAPTNSNVQRTYIIVNNSHGNWGVGVWGGKDGQVVENDVGQLRAHRATVLSVPSFIEASASDANAQLANALSALESILRSIISKLSSP